MKEAAKAVAAWDIDRIIPCHGVRLRPALVYLTDPLFAGRYRLGRKQGLERGV